MISSTASRTLLLAAETDVSLLMASADDASVAALTARLVTGEEAAWREFHDRYFNRLLRYLLVVSRGDEDAARDSLQAALVNIVRHVRRFDREEAWWGWLTVVVRSSFIDGVRRRSRYRALLERFAGIFSAPPAPADRERLPELLEECLAALPREECALLSAKYRDGQSVADLATEFSCSEKAMESRLARLRHRVKDALLNRLRHEI
jgi:RNA polymerase sigma-70 factor (ECF subfamily)